MSWFGIQNEKKVMKRRHSRMPEKGYVYRGVFVDENGVYCRFYPYSTNHDNNKKFFHKKANRIVRRRLGNEESIVRGGHKKIFDLWWKVI